MKAYMIKIIYNTGDSFHTVTKEEFIPIKVNNYEIAKENIRRIKEHWLYYKGKNDIFYNEMPKPNFVICEKYNPDFLELLFNEKDKYVFSPFWCGFFENLIRAEIIINDKNSYYDTSYEN